jgi:hypothetical protein
MKRICLALAFAALPLLLMGCNSSPPAVEPKPQGAAPAEHAGHGAGPHEGVVTDWGGGKYHVEFTVDHGKQEATVYILGSDEKTPAPVKATNVLLTIDDPKFEVELKPQPQEGDTEGASSRYVGRHEKLGIVRDFSGAISGEIEGTPYSGDFQEKPHAADHKH